MDAPLLKSMLSKMEAQDRVCALDTYSTNLCLKQAQCQARNVAAVMALVEHEDQVQRSVNDEFALE